MNSSIWYAPPAMLNRLDRPPIYWDPYEPAGRTGLILKKIHFGLGEQFSPLGTANLPDLTDRSIFLEQKFTMNGVGEGHIHIIDIGSSWKDFDPNANDLTILDSYDAPYGELRFTHISLPDMAEGEQHTLFPLELLEVRLQLDRPKEEKAAPILRVEFQDTPYRYWAVDHLGNWTNKREYDSHTAAYADWFFEQTGKCKRVAFNRNSKELANIRMAFLPETSLPPIIGNQL